MKKIKNISIGLLRTGLSPSRIAAAISLGIVTGVFPILGPFSVMCTAIALLFGLNVPVALASYYTMTFIQPLLIIPYLRIGEFIFGSDPMPLSLMELSSRFAEDAPATMAEFGWSFLHAAVGWIVLLPVLLVLLYSATLALISSWKKNMSFKPSAVLMLCMSYFSFVPTTQAWLFSPSEAHAFPDNVMVGTNSLSLSGTGTLKYKKLIPVYDAALFTGADGAKRLDVVYRVNADAKDFIEAGDRILRRNHDSTTIESMQQTLDELNAWYPDTKKGDTCSIIHVPGQGIELVYNGKRRGAIRNDEFARYYFSIWLGEDPASKTLKDKLLNEQQS